MSILGIIPARYASTRFPGKPLIDINGRTMILRVCDQAAISGVFDDILVATDDERILNHVSEAGLNVIMTSSDHQNGTERCLEALDKWEQLKNQNYDFMINIEGDEPFIHPEHMKKVAALLNSRDAQIATLAKQISRREEIFNPNVVKVVFNQQMEALYFSRCPVPYLREVNEIQWTKKRAHYKHIGIYGFRTEILRTACSLPPGTLEKLESLEQLRWLENGIPIRIDLTGEENISIDTPDDLLKITNIA